MERKLDSLQVLRAVAALLVVCFHASGMLADLKAPPAIGPVFAHFGQAGVDIFFILSGFLMVLTTGHKEPGAASAAAFLRNRLIRIVPMYWLLTTVLVLMLLAAPGLFHSMHLGARNVLDSYLFLPTVNQAGEPYPLLYVGWTLTFEMFFYAVFAAVLVFTRRLVVPVIGALFAGLVAVGLFTSGGVALDTLTSPLLLEFCAGGLLALLYLRGLPSWAALGAFLLAAAVLLAVLLDGTGAHRVLRYGVPAALLVAGFLLMDKAVRWPAVLRGIGDSSYSLYLSHIFVVPVGARVAVKLGLPPGVAFLAVVAVCVAVGHALYLLAERPMDRALRSRVRRSYAAGAQLT